MASQILPYLEPPLRKNRVSFKMDQKQVFWKMSQG